MDWDLFDLVTFDRESWGGSVFGARWELVLTCTDSGCRYYPHTAVIGRYRRHKTALAYLAVWVKWAEHKEMRCELRRR